MYNKECSCVQFDGDSTTPTSLCVLLDVFSGGAGELLLNHRERLFIETLGRRRNQVGGDDRKTAAVGCPRLGVDVKRVVTRRRQLAVDGHLVVLVLAEEETARQVLGSGVLGVAAVAVST